MVWCDPDCFSRQWDGFWCYTFCGATHSVKAVLKTMLSDASLSQGNLYKEVPYTFLAPCVCQYRCIDLLSSYYVLDYLHSPLTQHQEGTSGAFNKCLLKKWFHLNEFEWLSIKYLLFMCPAENKEMLLKNKNNKHQQPQKSPPVPLWTLEFSRGIKLAQGQNSRTV